MRRLFLFSLVTQIAIVSSSAAVDSDDLFVPRTADPIGTVRENVPEIELAVTSSGTSEVVLISCNECGHPASMCACEDHSPVGSGLGPIEAHGAGASFVGASPSNSLPACQFSNLYWCNPYGNVYLDPCDRGTCTDCVSQSSVTWYVTADLVPLFRDQQDDLAFQRIGQAGDVVLDSGSFETEFDAGGRLTGGVALTELFRLEGTYLGSYEWDDRVSVRNDDPNTEGTTGDLFGPFSNFGTPVPQIGTDFNNFASIEMTGKFNSYEINLRRRLVVPVDPNHEIQSVCVANSMLVGFRRINLDETFGYVTASTVPAGGTVNRANIATDNTLTGVQIGMLSQFMVRPGQGWVDFEIKGGIYENDTRLQSAFTSTDLAGAPIAAFTATDRRDRTAFLGELSLVYNRQLTQSFSYRLGYTALWLNGIALASENLNTDINLLTLGPAQVDHDGDLFLHGPSLGLTWAF